MNDPFASSPEVPAQTNTPVDPQDRDVFVHDRAVVIAINFMNEVADEDGRIKPGVEYQKVEKALSVAGQVMDKAKKYRKELQEYREVKDFEKAVVYAARQLPRDLAEDFLQHIEDALESPELTQAS